MTRLRHQAAAGVFLLLKGILFMTHYAKCFLLFDHSLAAAHPECNYRSATFTDGEPEET